MPDRPRLLLQLTVDLAILTVREDRLHVLVIERANPPFQGELALPGGRGTWEVRQSEVVRLD